PQTRTRLTVLGAASTSGSTNGTAISTAAVTISTRRGRLLNISAGPSFAAARAEQAARAHQQHERHRREQHDVRVAGVDHRGQADDLAGDQAADDRAGERADAADDDDDERLYEDRLADVGRERDDRRVDDAGEAGGHRADAEHDHEDAVDVDAERVDHHRILDARAHDHAE